MSASRRRGGSATERARHGGTPPAEAPHVVLIPESYCAPNRVVRTLNLTRASAAVFENIPHHVFAPSKHAGTQERSPRMGKAGSSLGAQPRSHKSASPSALFISQPFSAQHHPARPARGSSDDQTRPKVISPLLTLNSSLLWLASAAPLVP